MKVTFIHPNLGIGGAERLILDAAIAMKINGHEVEIVTNHYREDHCFEESKQFSIRTFDIFPQSFGGYAVAFCAYIRMCIAAFYVCISMEQDIIFCDSISVCLLVFRLFRLFGLCKAKLLFYCHFPDQLLTERRNIFKTIYRCFIDHTEAWTITLADVICVNSIFTKNVVLKTFPTLNNRTLHVLYPSLNTKFFDDSPSIIIDGLPEQIKYLFVSINRYERKKNIGLALEAFAELKKLIDEKLYSQCFLVIAGGFDRENEENLLYHRELKEYGVELQISTKQIMFLRSPADEVKVELLKRASAVLYTPENEHFGIVPIEAMYMKCCVIAVNSGGPMESIINGETGFLVESNAKAFADKMALLVKGIINSNEMGYAGHQRVLSKFTIDSFASQLANIVNNINK
ncbi:unnamed protein product [Dracunculus medinensis]|uniref:Alpha-1,3/1,6-mannosyltransferase ALG2 n=1 Tax=Dracunculus medinensis TaxID=318479 RepID=A0A0N4UFD9_DRAME|nr:unnamed protein product [Dracunculus medinensis]